MNGTEYIAQANVTAVANTTGAVTETDGNEGRNIWIDDFRAGGAYLTNPAGSTIDSTAQRYFQYRAIESTVDRAVSAYLGSALLDYVLRTITGRVRGGAGVGMPFIF